MALRVAMVGDVPADRSRLVGGVQSATIYLLEGLVANPEVEVHAITLDYRAAQDSRHEERGVIYHRLAVPPRFGLLTAHAAARARLNRLLDRIAPDVVHGLGTGVHSYAALHTGLPALLTVHGVQREDARYLGGVRNRLHGWLQAIWIERWCVTHARHVIVISPYLLRALPQLCRASLYHIPNPVADSFFDLRPQAEPGRILCAGVLTRRKRVLDALAAVARVRAVVPNVQLRLAGAATDPAYRRQLERFVAAHSLEPCVAFLGPLSADALADELQRAALLLLTSSQETAPVVIAEAMAAGKAVVATRVGGIPNMVEEGRTALLTRPGAIAETAAALQQLLTNPAECAALGRRGREYACQHFGVEQVAAATLAVYRKIGSG